MGLPAISYQKQLWASSESGLHWGQPGFKETGGRQAGGSLAPGPKAVLWLRGSQGHTSRPSYSTPEPLAMWYLPQVKGRGRFCALWVSVMPVEPLSQPRHQGWAAWCHSWTPSGDTSAMVSALCPPGFPNASPDTGTRTMAMASFTGPHPWRGARIREQRRQAGFA